jgi:hypothetical protein
MALELADRVRETTTVTGTSSAVLLGAVTGFQSFAVIGNGNTCYYTISDQSGPNWEVGIGTYSTSGPTLARTTILASSNSGSIVPFPAGTKDVFVTYPSEKSVNLDASGNVSPLGTVASATWQATTIAVSYGGTGLTTLTTGRIPYGAGTSAFGNSANLFFDSANTRLGVGTATPAVTAALVGTDSVLVPKGTTAEQPTGVTGYLRYNTTTNEFEGYSGSPGAWKSVGGSAISNDTSTASNLYPLFAAATSGTAQNVYTSNAKYLYKPSTGELQASEILASNGVLLNNQTMNTSYTMPSGYSGMSTGPFTVAGGVTFTIPSGSRHVVI